MYLSSLARAFKFCSFRQRQTGKIFASSYLFLFFSKTVGDPGIEPGTSFLSGTRSTTEPITPVCEQVRFMRGSADELSARFEQSNFNILPCLFFKYKSSHRSSNSYRHHLHFI